MEYSRAQQSEIGEARAERCLRGPSIGRPSSRAEACGWRLYRETRTQRRSDGTVSIDGVRFEGPSRLAD
jgi:hypothetical protein